METTKNITQFVYIPIPLQLTNTNVALLITCINSIFHRTKNKEPFLSRFLRVKLLCERALNISSIVLQRSKRESSPKLIFPGGETGILPRKKIRASYKLVAVARFLSDTVKRSASASRIIYSFARLPVRSLRGMYRFSATTSMLLAGILSERQLGFPSFPFFCLKRTLDADDPVSNQSEQKNGIL